MSGEEVKTNAALCPNGNNDQSTVENNRREEARRRQLAGLRPGWVPGQSGNPGGRREMPPEVKAALASAQLPAILKQIELLSCGDPRIEFVVSQALLDRFSGKALQATDVNVTTTNVQQAHLQVLVELQQKRDQAMKTIEAEEGGTQMVEEYGPLIAGDITYTKDNS